MNYTAKLLAAALISLLMAPLAANAAKKCKLPLTALSAATPSRSVSLASAKANWSVLAASNYTPQFANWGNASSKSTKCSVTTDITGVNQYVCKVTAKPCRL